VVSPAIARQLLSMLVNVVADPEATGTQAALPGYEVAGKTGTAAKPDPVTGGYSSSKYVASFVGIVPASKPRLVILVTVDEPQGTIWGGVVAAPAFREIARFDLQYLEVPPDGGSQADGGGSQGDGGGSAQPYGADSQPYGAGSQPNGAGSPEDTSGTGTLGTATP
jgi:membrane peptidoglycan carboxypeptidase